MENDKWFRIINDNMEDIPSRVKQLKSKYWQKAWLFIVLIVAGISMMSIGNQFMTIGLFIAIAGIAGKVAIAIMCHAQLCLYRAIMEIRKQNKSEQGVSPDA